jgi:hypothetical protein
LIVRKNEKDTTATRTRSTANAIKIDKPIQISVSIRYSFSSSDLENLMKADMRCVTSLQVSTLYSLEQCTNEFEKIQHNTLKTSRKNAND